MQEYGAKLAFHVIHPEYDRDGNILLAADEEGEGGRDVVDRRGGAKGGEAAADSVGKAKPLRVVGENNGGADGDKGEEDGAAPAGTTTTAEDGATTAGAKTADPADGALYRYSSTRSRAYSRSTSRLRVPKVPSVRGRPLDHDTSTVPSTFTT